MKYGIYYAYWEQEWKADYKLYIEKAAKSCKGVLSARWSQKSHQLTLVYDNAKTTPDKVQKAIAAAGHDTGSVKASNAAYNKLPSCCKYRSGSMKNCH